MFISLALHSAAGSVWLPVFALLAVASPEHDPKVLAPLFALGLVQIIEPRIGAVPAVVLKLVLSWILIGYGAGISSSLWIVLLLPVISAATNFGVSGNGGLDPRRLRGLSFFSDHPAVQSVH